MTSLNLPRVTSLDGVTRDWSDVFTSEPRHAHGPASTLGYIVRTTFFGGEAPHVDSAHFGATDYSGALALAHSIRAQPHHPGHAVIDTVYACGCRGNG